MVLSAIVPTHDRPAVLRQCLETLRDQDVDPSEFEVVVVDDGSATDVAALVREVAGSGPIEMLCVRQPLSGLNGARNRGAETARGELLAFLDDDTLVSAGWARSVLAAFAMRPCAAVGGKVELKLESPAPHWLAKLRGYLAEYDLGSDGSWIESELTPVGANCAVRRKEFERVGGFRLGLDRLADSLVSNGDSDFFLRLRAVGGRLWYEPQARVLHQVPAARLTKRYFTKRIYAQGVSDEMMRIIDGGAPTWKHRCRVLREIWIAAVIMAKDVVRGRGTWNARFQGSYWLGRLMTIGKSAPTAPDTRGEVC